MEFLNIGFTELLLIAIVVMVLFGPERTREGMRWAAQIGRASCRERV